MLNLRETYRVSDEYAKFAIAALFALMLAAIIGSIFLSTGLVIGLIVAVVSIWITFFRPTWTLAFLLWYLPFEPFLIKWIPDDIYVYARYFSEGLIYLLAIAVIWKILSGKIQWKSTPIDLPFVLLAVFCVASAILNIVPAINAVLGIRQILRFILLFFITVNLAPSRRWMKIVFIGLAAILSFQMLLGFAQKIVGLPLDTFLLPSATREFGEIQLTGGVTEFWDPGSRVFGTLGRYDQLGTWMAILLLLVVAALYEPKFKRYQPYLAALLLVGTVVLVMTYSRSSWFGFLIGFLFISLFAKRDKRVAIGLGITVALLGLYLAFSGLVVSQIVEGTGQTLAERFFETFSYDRWSGEYYGLGRMYWMVQTPLAVVPAAPIFGHGPGMYGGGAVAALHTTTVYDQLGLPFGVYGSEGYIDNNWFSLWGEIGTLGLAIYIWMYVTLFSACVFVYRQSKDHFTKALAIGVAAGLLAMALNAFLATFLETRTLAVYVWVFAGLVIALGIKEGLFSSHE